MRRPGYREFIRWVAENDSPADCESEQECAELVSACMVRDLFDVSKERVGKDIWRIRQDQLSTDRSSDNKTATREKS